MYTIRKRNRYMIELRHWCWSDGVLQLWMVLTSGYGVFRTAAVQPKGLL